MKVVKDRGLIIWTFFQGGGGGDFLLTFKKNKDYEFNIVQYRSSQSAFCPMWLWLHVIWSSEIVLIC